MNRVLAIMRRALWRRLCHSNFHNWGRVHLHRTGFYDCQCKECHTHYRGRTIPRGRRVDGLVTLTATKPNVHLTAPRATGAKRQNLRRGVVGQRGA